MSNQPPSEQPQGTSEQSSLPARLPERMQHGAVERFDPTVQSLILRGDVHVISPGFGSRQDQLSNPIATTYTTLPDGRRGVVVSNAWYPDKRLQIFDMEGNLAGVVNDPRFNGASAMTSDGASMYIADDSTGLIAKFSADGTTKEWEIKAPVRVEDLPGTVPPGFDISTYRHSRMIGSMTVTDEYLYAYNTAASKIQVFDKKTGALVREIGRHKVITLDQAAHEDLTADQEVRFNGHADIAMLGDQLITAHGGVNWGGAFELPNEVKVLSQGGELRASATLTSKVGSIEGITVSNSQHEVYMAMGNTVGVWGENGFVGQFKVPGCPEGAGRVFNIYLDEQTGDLIVSHGTGTGKQQYGEIIVLSTYAREELMKQAAAQRVKLLENSGDLPIGDQKEDIVAEKPVDLIYADEGEGVVEYKGQNPTIRDIFDLAKNPQTGKYRAVAVPVSQMPVELKQLLGFVGEMDYVAQFTDEIVFSPVLRGSGSYVPDRSAVPSTEESVGGAVINMKEVRDASIRPGKRILFINIGKMVEGQMQPREEVEMFDRVVHETRHRETIEKVAKGQEPTENRDNIVLMERVAYQRQMTVLQRLTQAYEQRGMTNNAIYLYLQDKIGEVQVQLDAIQRDYLAQELNLVSGARTDYKVSAPPSEGSNSSDPTVRLLAGVGAVNFSHIAQTLSLEGMDQNTLEQLRAAAVRKVVDTMFAGHFGNLRGAKQLLDQIGASLSFPDQFYAEINQLLPRLDLLVLDRLGMSQPSTVGNYNLPKQEIYCSIMVSNNKS